MTWNTFVKKYPDAVALTAAVSSSFPLDFDEKKQKLPSPYGLFLEWVEKRVTGDWTSAKVRGGFAVRLASIDDAKAIVAKYPALTRLKSTGVANKTAQISYRDTSYVHLAKELGYVLPVRKSL